MLKKLLLLVWCVLSMSACSLAPQTEALRSTGANPLPRQVELTEVPFYAQTEFHCGPAALATVLVHWKKPATPEQLAQQAYLPGRQGSLQLEMIAAARQHGVIPYRIEPKLKHLLVEVAAGFPVIVLQNLGLDSIPVWHYAVVIGYDLDQEEIILRSGTHRRWVTPLSVFERTWARAEHWALILSPPDAVGLIPKTAKLKPYLISALQLEQVGQSDTALKAYRSASLRWPKRGLPWMMRGNLAAKEQDWSQAATMFHHATLHPETQVPAWNNLAHAWTQLNCHPQAREALDELRKLGREDLARQAHAELSSVSKRNSLPSGEPTNCVGLAKDH